MKKPDYTYVLIYHGIYSEHCDNVLIFVSVLENTNRFAINDMD